MSVPYKRQFLEILAACLFLLVLSSSGLARDKMNAPFSVKSTFKQGKNYQTSNLKFVLSGMVNFYGKIISPADGPRSPSYPTGSAYGAIAIQQYGIFPGIIIIADRLLHESDINLGPTISVYGVNRYYDPIRNNTFWWDKSQVKKSPE